MIFITESKNCQKLTSEEMETHVSVEKLEPTCTVDTSIPSDWRKLNKLGWEVVHINECSDGTIQSVIFKAPKKCLSFRRGGTFHCDKLDFISNLSDEEMALSMAKMREANNKKSNL